MLADNRLGELASWDDGRLRLELEELKSLDLDFALEATGFELSEIDLRIGVAVGPAVDDRGRDQRSRPERRAPVARAGDTWALGPHRLVCADDAAGFSALDAAIRRWQAVTGESARLHPTGERFEGVARDRRDPFSHKREKVAGGSRPDEGAHA